MRVSLVYTTLFTVSLALAGCGGGSGGGSYGVPVPVHSTAPSSAPSVAPSVAPSSQPVSNPGDTKQAQIGGATALVDANSGLALYTFDGDTVANQSNCTTNNGCLSIWPAHAATSSESATGAFTIFKRSDNGTLQWAYKGKPLYTFVSDSPSANGTGDNFQGFHIARP